MGTLLPMTASGPVVVTVSAATAKASTPAPQVGVSVTVGAASAVGTTPAPTVIIGPSGPGYAVVQTFIAYPPSPEPGYHLGREHDFVAAGFVLGAAVFTLIVGGKLVAPPRIFKL
jgi:hypothetical protein